MSSNIIKRKILIDEPSNEDLFRGKGHERTAKALAKAICIFYREDRAIGLDGSWGSGKSSVVEIAEQKLLKTTTSGKTKFHFFTYDIWKSQGSSFRRSFLEHLLDWAKSNFSGKLEELKHIEKKVKGKVRKIHTNNQAVLDWYGISVLLCLPFIPIYYFWAKSVFDKLVEKDKAIEYLYSLPFILLLLLVLLTFAKAVWRHSKNKNSDSDAKFYQALSQTLLIGAKQYENQKVTQHIREIDPNDFEFQSIFRELLSIVQDKNDRVVVVLDNIDRLPRDEIAEHWALVRSVFSRGPLTRKADENSSITAIVPYDRHLIDVKENDAGQNNSQGSSLISPMSSREIFSKTFDEVLIVAPPVMSNSRDFFHEKIGKALPNISDKDDLFRVYLIFNKILQKEKGTATPRQIISFINELTGLYVLHDGQFRLPTVAVFIAYQDALDVNPTYLSSRTLIDERLRVLAADEELDRNLAAMIFNVEPDLAFQLLLDDKIKNAAVSSIATKLASLAQSPGFDLRVNEVVQNNVSEWRNSGEFGAVIENFASLADGYEGNAAQHFSKSLVAAFREVESIELAKENYSPYLTLYSLCDHDDLTSLTSHLVSCVLKSLKERKNNEYVQGQDLVTFLDKIHQSLASIDQSELLERIMGTVSLPSDPDFLFGVASNTPDSHIDLVQFKKPTLDFPEDDEEFFERMAIEYPNLALHAFSEFNNISLLDDDQWVSIANSLLMVLVAGDVEDSDISSSQIRLISNVWVYTDSEERSEIDLNLVFGNVQFYQNIHGEYSDDLESQNLAHALFLAGQGYLESGFATPIRLRPNGQRIQESSSEFTWFKGLIDGDSPLTKAQYETIAKQAKRALRVTHWLTQGRSKQDNQFIAGVVECAFLLPEIPRIAFSTFISSYEYLKDILSNEFIGVLSRFGGHITKKELSALTIDSCPLGLLADAHETTSDGWQNFHERVDALLQKIPADNWRKHLEEADHTAQILLEKISTSGYAFRESDLRNVFITFALDVLSGQVTLSAESLNYDRLMEAIDENYHADMYRKTREDLYDVTAATLENASQLFPQFVTDLLSVGDRISQREKDSIVRHLLCSALEGDNRIVLRGFRDMGRNKVADFIKRSNKSTQDKKDGAWNHFAENCQDHDWNKQIGELLHGKRKARKFLDIIFGSKSDEEREE